MLQAEDKIRAMLSHSVIVQWYEDGTIEVAAVDPVSFMQAVGNPALAETKVRDMLKQVVDEIPMSGI